MTGSWTVFRRNVFTGRESPQISPLGTFGRRFAGHRGLELRPGGRERGARGEEQEREPPTGIRNTEGAGAAPRVAGLLGQVLALQEAT